MLLHTRRHPIYVITRLIAYVIAVLVPVVALLLVASATSGLGSTFGKIAMIVAVAWLAMIGIRAYFTWFRWVNDLWVVTNQRIVDSTKKNWFDHRMASADLVDVEDIAVHRLGLLPTMFKFGDVRCQTAGEQPNFVMAGIPNPGDVLAIVDSARDASRRELGRPLH